MAAIEQEYGPLDWRVPEAHAVYRAHSGVPYARKDFDLDGLRRMVFQSLIALFQQGDYHFVDGELINLPDVDLFPHVDRAFQNAYASGTRKPTFDEAYYNFLLDALILNFYYQRDAKAREIFAELRAAAAEKTEGLSYESFIAALNQQPIQDMRRHRALALINSLLISAEQLRADGKPEEARQLETVARQNWEAFQATRDNPNFMARTGLPSFEGLAKLAARQAAEGM